MVWESGGSTGDGPRIQGVWSARSSVARVWTALVGYSVSSMFHLLHTNCCSPSPCHGQHHRLQASVEQQCHLFPFAWYGNFGCGVSILDSEGWGFSQQLCIAARVSVQVQRQDQVGGVVK